MMKNINLVNQNQDKMLELMQEKKEDIETMLEIQKLRKKENKLLKQYIQEEIIH